MVVCPNKPQFLRSIINLNDVISASLLLITYVTGFAAPSTWSSSHWVATLRGVATTLYMLRMLRLFTFVSHMARIRVLLLTIRASIWDILPFLMVIFLGVLLSSVFVYYAEVSQENTLFTSIPAGFWWAVVTMTTVGYGDILPVSPSGKTIGSLWAVSGMLILLLPVPVYIRHFTRGNELVKMHRELERRHHPTSSDKSNMAAPSSA